MLGEWQKEKGKTKRRQEQKDDRECGGNKEIRRNEKDGLESGKIKERWQK